MIKLLTVIGARPQIIKAAAISRAIQEHFSDQICERILHTGQHYDDNMSGVFFEELGIPHPDYNLGVGSGRHGEQTAKMIAGIEEVLLSEHFDGIILYGDTNSTLAGAVAASKLHVPIFHIEAGLRSYNMAMPEEINRIVCDRLSTILFAPTETAVQNLTKEGFKDGNGCISGQVVLSGDVMYDNALYFGSRVGESLFQRYGLVPGDYVLATVHRDFNTDNPQRLQSIFNALIEVSKERQVVLPLHPRTAKLLQQISLDLSTLNIIPPMGFLEMLALEKHSALVMTDSGGVQKEAFFFERPCVIMRLETEWVEIVDQGAGILTDADTSHILDAYHILSNLPVSFPPLFGDGHAAVYILQEILKFINK